MMDRADVSGIASLVLMGVSVVGLVGYILVSEASRASDYSRKWLDAEKRGDQLLEQIGDLKRENRDAHALQARTDYYLYEIQPVARYSGNPIDIENDCQFKVHHGSLWYGTELHSFGVEGDGHGGMEMHCTWAKRRPAP